MKQMDKGVFCNGPSLVHLLTALEKATIPVRGEEEIMMWLSSCYWSQNYLSVQSLVTHSKPLEPQSEI